MWVNMPMVDFPDMSAAKASNKLYRHLAKYDQHIADKIVFLAGLPKVEYDQQRKEAALHLGVRPATLDAEVTATRRDMADPEAALPEFSDDDLALRFSEKYKDHLRYTAKFGSWNEWVGSHWKPDETLHVFTLARVVCREASQECHPSVVKSISSAATVAAVERLARNDRKHATRVDRWDSDPWIIATPGGTVDLKTGELHPPSPNDHCTKVTAVTPGGACPIWRDFLKRVTNNDDKLQTFLQRVIGYSLTGTTTEQALFFFYGTGGNGKGVFLNTISSILGDYASVASMDTFTSSPSDRHPTDLAMLRGARLAVSQETEEGRAWAESRVKAMTGGDPITARFMRQDFFTYQPQFKLMIAGNHKPSLKNVDAAIRRRFNLIPFTVTIPKHERDLDLPDKLKAEWPGILQWAIDGCIGWQEVGLKAPQVVTDATDEYLSSEDGMSLWLKDRCEFNELYDEQSTNLYKDYAAWMMASGEKPSTQKSFTQAMEGKGYSRITGRRHATFKGIRLEFRQTSYHETADDRA